MLLGFFLQKIFRKFLLTFLVAYAIVRNSRHHTRSRREGRLCGVAVSSVSISVVLSLLHTITVGYLFSSLLLLLCYLLLLLCCLSIYLLVCMYTIIVCSITLLLPAVDYYYLLSTTITTPVSTVVSVSYLSICVLYLSIYYG